MDVNISRSVSTSEGCREEVLHRIVLSHLRGEGHHLPRGRVGTHVRIAQIDIILLDGDDTIHGALEGRALLTLDGAPLTIDDVLLGDLRCEVHQLSLDTVLDLLDSDLRIAMTELALDE